MALYKSVIIIIIIIITPIQTNALSRGENVTNTPRYLKNGARYDVSAIR